VPIPRAILDHHMPELTDTQLRVILAVARQTLGWRDPAGGRKKREWISHSWLKKMTGRSGASVSAAVDGLVRLGLIAATNATGRQLLSKEARRSARGRIYYELAGAALAARIVVNKSKDEVEKLKTIKDTYIKESNRQQSKMRQGGWARAGACLKPPTSKIHLDTS